MHICICGRLTCFFRGQVKLDGQPLYVDVARILTSHVSHVTVHPHC